MKRSFDPKTAKDGHRLRTIGLEGHVHEDLEQQGHEQAQILKRAPQTRIEGRDWPQATGTTCDFTGGFESGLSHFLNGI